MIEITMVKNDLIWQELSWLTFSDKNSGKLSLKCRNYSKKILINTDLIKMGD